MIAFTNDSPKTQLEDGPVTKGLQQGAPLPWSNQGGFIMQHYGVISAPRLHILFLILALLVQYLILRHIFIPVTRVPGSLVFWLMSGGLLGAWMCHFGTGRRKVARSMAKAASPAERAAIWARFPMSITAVNILGSVLLFSLTAFEIALWLYGAHRLNIERTMIPPTVVVGVAAAWVIIALMHYFFSGNAMWILATGLVRSRDLRASRRRYARLSEAPLYVHGYRRTKIVTGVPLSFAYANKHCLIPQEGREANPSPRQDAHVSLLHSFGNFNGNDAAELCQDQLNADQKAMLACELEQAMVNLANQPALSQPAAVSEAHLMAAIREHAALGPEQAAAVARAFEGESRQWPALGPVNTPARAHAPV